MFAECSVHCKINLCEQFTANCTDCDDGYWGFDCNEGKQGNDSIENLLLKCIVLS